MAIHNASADENVKINAVVDAKVQRGGESWNFIYIFLGFALSIEGTIVGMTPLIFPYNIILYAVIGFVTFRLFINNGSFHNKLLGWKNSYESEAR